MLEEGDGLLSLFGGPPMKSLDVSAESNKEASHQILYSLILELFDTTHSQ